MARELEIDIYTLLYLKPIVNKDLQYSTWNSAQCYVAAWIKERIYRAFLMAQTVKLSVKPPPAMQDTWV